MFPTRHSRPAWALGLTTALACNASAAPLQVQVIRAGGQPVADAVVFLESRDAKAAARPLQGVEIAQQNKQFAPTVTVVTVGTQVQFPNRDTVRHHVYSFSPAKPFELKLYAGTPANPVLFDKPGVAVLGCNIHDTMAAWVLVLETPYFARTDAQGRARFDDVPAGTWRLRGWHADLPVGAPASDQALVTGSAAQQVALRLELPATP